MLKSRSLFARGTARNGTTTGPVPPTALVLLAVASVQLGASIAKHLFETLGPAGTSFLRVGIGALVLLLVWRPRLHGYTRNAYVSVALFGIALAAMNTSFYFALDRIPLGIAVTLEFVGPLGVAVAGSRRALDLLWTGLAAAGVVLLTPWGGLHLDVLGAAFALLAGAFWAAYILLSARVGRVFPGGSGLAIALGVGAILLLPAGFLAGGSHLLDFRVLAMGTAVGLLSSVIPYSLELEALRKLPTRVFGVLMSTEPAVAAVIGYLILREVLNVRAVIAILLVTAAAAGTSRFKEPEPAG
ncbi:MAG TPA: EamA family transporter [Chloroflexota bacterium]